jgi:superfamily II DNA or RNA helicase
MPELRKFTQNACKDGTPKLRIATTSYLGATDFKAIKLLMELPNTEIKISYDTKRTRLHAKAYLFHRESQFSTAYIGSANISKAALDDGLEWTAKISQYETVHLWKYAIATFECHWEDDTEFSILTEDNINNLKDALNQESLSPGIQTGIINTFFDLKPFSYQNAILEDIQAERRADKHKHLIIAATGTGKTMIAAFDYKNYCTQFKSRPNLLFIAHREEILNQALSAFRQVLRDNNFGDIICSGNNSNQDNHLFCTVQSWNSREFFKFKSDHFDYIVLDEAHHAQATSYQKIINHINPKSLIGLTATPDRTDGKDIRDDFGGAFTHEISLSQAVDRTLLSPFHYYGIPDLEGLDFSSIAWKRGGYDVKELSGRVANNEKRAQWVIRQIDEHVRDIKKIRALGFCISVEHAKFMADICNKNNIPSLALTGESDRKTVRPAAQQNLESYNINIIFTVDLYNEGVDIKFIDTVIFLRPTESIILFLQQLGRGLRLDEGKSHLTVLDFIAPQNQNFSYAQRFEALSSEKNIPIDRQIENQMPFLPSGCLIHLEKRAQKVVLDNIKNCTSIFRKTRFLQEFKRLLKNNNGFVNMSQILDHFKLDNPDKIYKNCLPHKLIESFTDQPAIDRTITDLLDFQKNIQDGFRRFLLMDDTELINKGKSILFDKKIKDDLIKSIFFSVLLGDKKPGNGSLQDVEAFFLNRPGLMADLKELLNWLLNNKIPVENKNFDFSGPLNLHASYTRKQILLALGKGSYEQPFNCREGVLHMPEKKIDIFFADINKNESDFSPTTMYDDYAISKKLFHWQSQSSTSSTSKTGKRYINHENLGYKPILFIRKNKKYKDNIQYPFFYAGPLKYVKHEGSKPVSFVWELETPLPAKVMSWAGRAN